jgi:hypothetical protein
MKSDYNQWGIEGLSLPPKSPPTINSTHLFYIVDWLPPDFGAVGQYALIFAREIAQSGRTVSLIGLTSGTRQGRVESFGTGSLEINWIPAHRYDKSGLVTRLLWSIKANVRLILEVATDPRSRGAEILFTGSPPFMLFFAVITKWLRSARLIYRITDFYPEVLIAAIGKRSASLTLFEKLTWWFRKRVDNFEVLGEDQRRLLLSGGIFPNRIRLKRDISPVRVSREQQPAQRPPALASQKILLYSGNYGVAHEVDTIVQGLIRHRSGGGHFGLWLNASGSAIMRLVERLNDEGVPVALTEPAPLERLPGILSAADVQLITLRSAFSGLVLPSKIYACLDSGRPILFVGPKSSDIHLLCTETSHFGYHQVEPGDVDAFVRALIGLERIVEHANRTHHLISERH